jgi:hypothetical protein
VTWRPSIFRCQRGNGWWSLVPIRDPAHAMSLLLTALVLALVVGAPETLTAQVICPSGSYVATGPCRICPDGTYVGGGAQCQLAPDGSYVPESRRGPQLAPNGSYQPGGPLIMCPDGTYVVGQRCVLTPNGSYVGM